MKKEWWQDSFDDKYLKTYIDTFKPEDTARQVNFIASKLGIKKSATILDLACGYGRVSNQLAKKGYKVTGLDYSKHFLKIAEKEAKDQRLSVAYVHQDMRKLNAVKKFDAVLSMFTSFGYFKSEEDNNKVLKNISNALKPAGKLLIDLNNAVRNLQIGKGSIDAKGRMIQSGEVTQSNGLVVKTDHIVDPSSLRWMMHRSWKEDGKMRSYDTDLRIYTLPELTHLLEENGLKVKKVFGGFDGSKFTFNSRRLIVLAEKI